MPRDVDVLATLVPRWIKGLFWFSLMIQMRRSNDVAPEKLPSLATGPLQDNLPSNIHLSDIFSSMFYFYKSLKTLETKGFLIFSGGMEMKHWAKMGK